MLGDSSLSKITFRTKQGEKVPKKTVLASTEEDLEEDNSNTFRLSGKTNTPEKQSIRQSYNSEKNRESIVDFSSIISNNSQRLEDELTKDLVDKTSEDIHVHKKKKKKVNVMVYSPENKNEIVFDDTNNLLIKNSAKKLKNKICDKKNQHLQYEIDGNDKEEIQQTIIAGFSNEREFNDSSVTCQGKKIIIGISKAKKPKNIYKVGSQQESNMSQHESSLPIVATVEDNDSCGEISNKNPIEIIDYSLVYKHKKKFKLMNKDTSSSKSDSLHRKKRKLIVDPYLDDNQIKPFQLNKRNKKEESNCLYKFENHRVKHKNKHKKKYQSDTIDDLNEPLYNTTDVELEKEKLTSENEFSSPVINKRNKKEESNCLYQFENHRVKHKNKHKKKYQSDTIDDLNEPFFNTTDVELEKDKLTLDNVFLSPVIKDKNMLELSNSKSESFVSMNNYIRKEKTDQSSFDHSPIAHKKNKKNKHVEKEDDSTGPLNNTNSSENQPLLNLEPNSMNIKLDNVEVNISGNDLCQASNFGMDIKDSNRNNRLKLKKSKSHPKKANNEYDADHMRAQLLKQAFENIHGSKHILPKISKISSSKRKGKKLKLDTKKVNSSDKDKQNKVSSYKKKNNGRKKINDMDVFAQDLLSKALKNVSKAEKPPIAQPVPRISPEHLNLKLSKTKSFTTSSESVKPPKNKVDNLKQRKKHMEKMQQSLLSVALKTLSPIKKTTTKETSTKVSLPLHLNTQCDKKNRKKNEKKIFMNSKKDDISSCKNKRPKPKDPFEDMTSRLLSIALSSKEKKNN